MCFHYDPSTGRYNFAVMAASDVLGVADARGLATFMLVMFRRDRRQSRAGRPANFALGSRTEPRTTLMWNFPLFPRAGLDPGGLGGRGLPLRAGDHRLLHDADLLPDPVSAIKYRRGSRADRVEPGDPQHAARGFWIGVPLLSR